MSAAQRTWFLVALALASLQGTVAAEPENEDSPRPTKNAADLKFTVDTFTFVRVKHSQEMGTPLSRRRWATDYPDADLNLSARFAKVTGLKSDPNGKVLTLTSPALKQFPFIYIVEPGSLQLTDAEAKSLRTYLLDGGFLMVDDFWGELEWENFASEFKKVFPDREPKELPLSHPVFHSFYKIESKPQVLSIHAALTGGKAERPDGQEPHYRGVTDDRGRLMAIICHNTDLGDGWERQHISAEYFREYCQKKAFPMGVNILVHALTQQDARK